MPNCAAKTSITRKYTKKIDTSKVKNYDKKNMILKHYTQENI